MATEQELIDRLESQSLLKMERRGDEFHFFDAECYDPEHAKKFGYTYYADFVAHSVDEAIGYVQGMVDGWDRYF